MMTDWLLAREQIKTGDMIFMLKADGFGGSLVQNIITIASGSSIYHCGIACWMTSETGIRRLMLCETNPEGKRLVPVTHYGNTKMNVISIPRVDSLMLDSLLQSKIADVNYGWLDLVGVILRERFAIPVKDQPGLICSQFCAETWKALGLYKNEPVVSPGRLYRNLLGEGYSVAFTTQSP